VLSSKILYELEFYLSEFSNLASMLPMKRSKLLSNIKVNHGLVLDGLELFLREKKSPFPFEFSSLQEARDYMSMSAFMKREYLINIFKEQTEILEFHEENPEMSYENLSSLNMPRILRKCFQVV